MLDFLLKRAEARIPIYKKDLPENITLSKKLSELIINSYRFLCTTLIY